MEIGIVDVRTFENYMYVGSSIWKRGKRSDKAQKNAIENKDDVAFHFSSLLKLDFEKLHCLPTSIRPLSHCKYDPVTQANLVNILMKISTAPSYA